VIAKREHAAVMRRAQHIDLVSEKPLVGEMRACKYECRLGLHMPKELTWVDTGRLIISTDRTTATAPIACSCDLTTQAEPRRTSDVNRESGTESANRRWLQRIVRLFRGN
jgi:hypothetical protein